MKRLIFFLLFSCSAWATLAPVQKAVNNACSGTTCVLTVSSTGTGHIIVIGAISVNSGGRTLTGISGGGTYVHCSGSVGDNVGAGHAQSSDIYYTLASTSGTTSITVTISPSTAAWTAEMQEVSFTGTVAVDVCGNVNNTVNTSRGGVDLTALTGTTDLLYQVVAMSGSVSSSAIGGAYSSQTDFGTAYGFASAVNTATGTAPTWTFSGNAFSVGSGLAISETSSTPSIMIGGLIEIN